MYDRQILPRLMLCGLMLWLGCGDDAAGVELSGDTPCEKYISLARIHGCSVQEAESDCPALPDACTKQANAWLECAARDKAQCYCESDNNDLNCEGSFKPDEGPALCQSEYRAFHDCAEP